ncbi:Acetoin utilization protein AcuC [Rubrobacter xylanophilus DSM 9941]|uniref:acetoin utilization protein AcuC n=1 Tax=Rubrobacter xylanophilus TaxID=49319 RepID=UPI001C6445C9|nr:acetoin utilization protein AcuC [Rubrobacter xylanophilus]QYJ14239.1 Acetoin utilization protein AcuC [Rubrobacter xylanophilus DSM 9941]
MSGRAAIVHDRSLEDYGFGKDHPFNPLRIRLALELCDALGLLEDYRFLRPEPVSEEELTSVHTLTYVRMVQQAGAGTGDPAKLLDYGLGTPDNPVFPGMHEACSRVVGGTVLAARLVVSGEVEHAMCISGGLHHALRSKASGFCVYNDAAVAIALLKREHPGIRIAYVDTDAHHGDGVQWMFYEDPEVLTVSMHESGRYLFPGTGGVDEKGRGEGVGYSVNVPLEPFTGDDSWIECFEAVVPKVLRAFGPDLIVSQNGCDGHALDPLTHLCATTRLYEHIPRRMHELAHELCDGRWVALGGGGYDHWRVVPRAWSALWAAVSHQPLPENLPEGWLLEHAADSPVELPRRMHDDPGDYPPVARTKEIVAANRRTAEAALETVLHLIRR